MTVLGTIVAPFVAVLLFFSAVLYAFYNPAIGYVTPVLWNPWVFPAIAGLILVNVYAQSVRLWRADRNLRPLFLTVVALGAMVPLYWLSLFVKLDIPYSQDVDGHRYEIPWDYNPSGSQLGLNALEEFLQVNFFYPGFSKPPTSGGRSKLGFNVVACFGTCFQSVNGAGGKPLGRYLLDKVQSRLQVDESQPGLQTSEFDEDGKTTTYFFHANTDPAASRLYGICATTAKFVACHYLITGQPNFYDVTVRSNNAASVAHWNLDRDLPAINRGMKALIASFQQ